jgi:hypothetical protein
MLARLLRTSGPFRLFIVAVAVAAVVAVVAVASSGSSDHARRAAVERAQLRALHSEQARIRAAERRDPVLRRERARLRADQRAHFARVARGVAAWPIGSHAEQAAVVGALERSITRDAVARWHAGSLNTRVHRTLCQHLVRPNRRHPPPPPLSAAEAGYECTAITTAVPPSSRTEAAIIGFPFWARVDFRAGRLAWCKVNLLPSEHGIGDSLAFVPLPRVCDVLPKGGPA